MNRQKVLLVILLGVLILGLVYAFWKTPRQHRISQPGEKQPPIQVSRKAEKGESATGLTRVQLELLNRENKPFPGFKKDIFGPLFVEKPPAPPPVAKAPLPPPPPPMPPPVVAQELARFNFLGFLEKDREKTIFLSSGNDIFVVHKGDRFGKDQQFQVAELSPDKLVIRQDDDPRPINISLAENAPLMPSTMKSPSRGPTRRPPVFNRPLPGQQETNPSEQPGTSETMNAEPPPQFGQPESNGTMPPAGGMTQ